MLATSGRLLAWAANAAGYAVDVADLFGDHDCLTLARQFHRLPAASVSPWLPDPASVIALVARWARAHPDGVLLPGSGFESHPDVLTDMAAHLPVAGNSGSVVHAAKNPWLLGKLCAAAGVFSPTLRTAVQPPTDRATVCKPVGCSGGNGVVLWPRSAGELPASPVPADHYLQDFKAGQPVSLLFFAHCSNAAAAVAITPVSVQTQHPAPTPTQPFRLGGLVRLGRPQPLLLRALLRAAGVLAEGLKLQGLNGLDGIWDGERLWVLEINPRPPLSLALQTRATAARLLRAHIDGTTMIAAEPCSTGLSPGVALVYASRTLSIPADFRFPSGCHDVPFLPHHCAAGAPLCSVHVATGGVEELRARVRDLRECLLPVAGVESVSSL